MQVLSWTLVVLWHSTDHGLRASPPLSPLCIANCIGAERASDRLFSARRGLVRLVVPLVYSVLDSVGTLMATK